MIFRTIPNLFMCVRLGLNHYDKYCDSLKSQGDKNVKKILLLDPSIATSNVGDEIITECVNQELAFLTEGAFVYRIPTHLPAFHSYATWIKSCVAQSYGACDYKFAGGSNLMVKNMLSYYPQWNINLFNCKPLAGTILVGVGAGAEEKSNHYTERLYRKVLSADYFHSVRDDRSKAYVESLGLKAINTGCVTMWKLTPEFCRDIPREKASRCVFTLTGRPQGYPVRDTDQQLVDILKRCYDTVYFWVQGDLDWAYFQKLERTDGIKIVPPSKDAYHQLLCEDDLDYIGTRLHGGVYAMRHKKRAIIIAIDERASAINAANNLNCIEQSAIATELEPMIRSEFETKIVMPFDRIEAWRSQFR